MNNLSSRQRKLIYAGGILALLIPIIWLGAPTSSDVQPGVRMQTAGGGRLAQMRLEYDLGESTLGNVDPTSSAMNLVLLGLRGPAAGILHLKAIEYQERKDWGKLRSTVDSIIRLQPHYIKIWNFQGWNLAFNVSAQWDVVDDRFYWVKEGAKFLMGGIERNQTSAILYDDVGIVLGRKIGGSDESKYFREFFRDKDPDEEKYGGLPDPVLNPNREDNYLVAKQKYLIGNEVDEVFPVKGKTPEIFRQNPVRSQFDYAQARQNDGQFDTITQRAWADAKREWENDYGNYFFYNDRGKFKLNVTPAETEALAAENGVSVAVQKGMQEISIDMVNFRFWRDLADIEQKTNTVEAHRLIYEAKEAHRQSRNLDSIDADGNLVPSEAETTLLEGMKKFEEVIAQKDDHDHYIEEAMLAVHYYHLILSLNTRPIPDEYPLKDVWDRHPNKRPQIARFYEREQAAKDAF